VQFHFHWGSESHCGSEHLLNGRQFSAELHLVHRNVKYATMEEALTKEDGLCVVGVFIEAGGDGDNLRYQPVIEYVRKVAASSSDDGVKVDQVDCKMLLPENSGHLAAYRGSLTTPPYSECVQWVNLLEPVVISEGQMAEFRRLEAANGKKMVNNYRNIQSLFGRKIAHCCNC